MSSKRMRAGIAAAWALGLLSFSACGLRIGEAPVSSTRLNLGKEAGCLAGGMNVMVDFTAGRATDAQLTSFWTCAERSMQMFVAKTRGQEPGVYSSRELRNFLENYFLNVDPKDRRITVSDRMMNEMMEIKRTLLGGNGDRLSTREIEQVGTLISVLKDAALLLRPYMPISAEAYADRPEKDLTAALNALQTAALKISGAIQKSGYDYQFSHLAALLEEYERVPGMTPETVRSLRDFRESLPLIQELKAILISPQADRVAGSDWDTIMVQTSQWYGALLRFKLARKRYPSLIYGDGREAFVSLAHDLVRLLDESLSRRGEDRRVTFAELDALISRLDPAMLTFVGPRGPRFVTPANAKLGLRVLIQRVFGGQGGVNRATLRRASNLIEEWAAGQRYLDHVWMLSGKGGTSDRPPTQSLSRAEFLMPPAEDVLASIAGGGNPRSARVARVLREQVQSSTALYLPGDDVVTLARVQKEQPEVQRSYEELSRFQLFHFLGRIFVRGYGLAAAKDGRPGDRVSMSEVEQFYYDIRGIGVDLKLFDPINMNTVKRFVEADLFTFDSNGDRQMSAEEAAGALAFMSSTKIQAGRLHDAIAEECHAAGGRASPQDFFDYDLIDPVCYRREFFGNFAYALRRLPGMVAYFQTLKAQGVSNPLVKGCDRYADGSRERFECALENAARSGGVSAEKMNSSDSEALYGLAEYMEAIFIRYDRNGDGRVDLDEAIDGSDSAFATFRAHLADATCKIGSCLTGSSSLKTVFTFMLVHGRPPSTLEFVGWFVARPTWGWFVHADRARLADILGNLSRVMSKPAPPSDASAAAFFYQNSND